MYKEKGCFMSNKIGFDNDKYLKMQSERIRERIADFGSKLYLEFGGTSRRSPATLNTQAITTAISGVRESPMPRNTLLIRL